MKVRESRDSADNPKSVPITLAVDVTGSMGILADTIVRKGLGIVVEGILERFKDDFNPHIQLMAIGDVHMGDRAPLQVTQFEADNRIVDQTTKIFLEHGGGGNGSESYHLAWYFAAFHIEHDSIEKRGKRGYLFTIGDESTPPPLNRSEIHKVTGDSVENDFDAKTLLELAQRKFDCYHIIVEEGYAGTNRNNSTHQAWRDLIGEKVIYMSDHQKLAEIIVSAIEVAEGRDADASAKKWGGMTANVVFDAVKHLPRGQQPRLPGPR